MSTYELVVTFFTIIYGLMLADMFSSLHKLITAKKSVKWHWLPLLAAWYLFLIILKNWWDLYSFQNSPESMNIYFFIAYGHLSLLLFLLVSTALPDKVEGNVIDLRTFYFNNHRYFWGLMTATVVLSTLITFFKQMETLDQIEFYKTLLPTFVFIALLIVLATNRKYWIHSTLLILFVIETTIEIISK